MSWFTKITKTLRESAETLGNSVAYLKRKFGVTITDAQVDKVVEKLDGYTDKLEKIGVEILDDIPGVPNELAVLAAAAFMNIIDAGIAGAGEAIKAKN